MKLKSIIIILVVLGLAFFVRAELTDWEVGEIRELTLSLAQLNQIPKDKQPENIQAKLIEEASIFSGNLREYKIIVDGDLIGVKFSLSHLKSKDEESLSEVVKDTILEQIEFESIK